MDIKTVQRNARIIHDRMHNLLDADKVAAKNKVSTTTVYKVVKSFKEEGWTDLDALQAAILNELDTRGLSPDGISKRYAIPIDNLRDVKAYLSPNGDDGFTLPISVEAIIEQITIGEDVNDICAMLDAPDDYITAIWTAFHAGYKAGELRAKQLLEQQYASGPNKALVDHVAWYKKIFRR